MLMNVGMRLSLAVVLWALCGMGLDLMLCGTNLVRTDRTSTP
jgi:hypothetical protein